MLENILGVGGLIPENWKAAVMGFLVAIVALLAELGVVVPDWITESMLAKVAAVIYILIALVLKWTRSSRRSAGQMYL